MTTSMRQSGNRRLLILLVAIVVSSNGCGPEGYRDPIAKFQDASSVVVASIRLYVTELNKVERDHYIQSQLSERAQIKLNELEAVQIFTWDGLKARLDALDQLAGYGDLLTKLANSDAPERIKAEAKGLGDTLGNLSTTVSKLTSADDKDFKAAVGPASTIVGEILNLVVQQKLKEALDKAVKEGEAPINSLLKTIRNDISIAYERKRSALSDVRVSLVDEYSKEMRKGTKADPERLRLFAERIREHEDRWEIFASANPGEGLDAMADAHAALVTYAKSKHEITDLASLVDAMEAFAARAKSIGQAVQALRQI